MISMMGASLCSSYGIYVHQGWLGKTERGQQFLSANEMLRRFFCFSSKMPENALVSELFHLRLKSVCVKARQEHI
jgi:hypothetical protein